MLENGMANEVWSMSGLTAAEVAVGLVGSSGQGALRVAGKDFLVG